MAIVKWKRASYPGAPSDQDSEVFFRRIQEDWDRLFGWSPYSATSGLFDSRVSPSFDLMETAEGCTVWADLPGLDKKDLELTVAGNVLTLKGGKDKEQFQRSLSLPETVDPNKIAAEYRDGVLTVTLAKRPEHKPRQIPVAVR